MLAVGEEGDRETRQGPVQAGAAIASPRHGRSLDCYGPLEGVPGRRCLADGHEVVVMDETGGSSGRRQ